MIKVAEQDGEKSQLGYDAMTEIVKARMDLSLFEDITYLNNMIEYSGGSLRTLFRMIIEAASNAEEDERAKINDADWKSAYNRTKNEYRNTIADYVNDKGEVKIHATDFYKVLEDLMNSKTKDVLNSQTAMLLRQNTCILSYNGTGWNDVHPIVKDILIERAKG
jgi:hypothetical protein